MGRLAAFTEDLALYLPDEFDDDAYSESREEHGSGRSNLIDYPLRFASNLYLYGMSNLTNWMDYRPIFSSVPRCSYCGVRPNLLPPNGKCVQCGAPLL